jgi:Domain of unknown function (DUF1707)
MTTGPGDERAAAGRDRLRAGHADREQLIEALQAAFVAGMLAKDEFDLRVGQALASRSCPELATLTADLPAGLAGAQPPKPAQGRGEGRVPRLGLVFTAGTVAYTGVWLVAFALPDSGPDHDSSAGVALVTMATFFYIFFALMFGTQILSDWLDKRSGRQLPRGPAPGAGGQASRRPPSAGRGGQLPPADPGHRHTGEAAPIRRRPPRRGHFLRRQYATN